jgi:hypothetical protein|tara:strand:- start:4056 stop:4691 length:636 start_codon:yes stop_codon:yes gene_type:complete
MATEINAFYDESSQWKPTEEGDYPAHISGLTTKEMMTKAGEAVIVNMTYKIADEAADLKQLVYEMDGYKYKLDQEGNRIPIKDNNGEQITTDCSHLVGEVKYDSGWFIFTSSESGSKNARYFRLLESLGIKVEEQRLGDKKVKKLVLLEQSDVVGKPVIIDLQREEYVTSDTKHLPPEQQDRRSVLKVKNVQIWSDGVEITEDEVDGDVPF